MKPWGKILLMGLCVAVTVTAVSLFSPAYARYNNIASTAVKYDPSLTMVRQTNMSADTAVYDFGVWTPDVDNTIFEHTLQIADTQSISGVMRFSWDDTTRTQRDMAVYIESEYYTSVQNSGYADYTVSATDGDLALPFSLIFATPTMQRVATLDVSWYPDGSAEPTLFARYLLAVVPEESTATNAPSFVEEDTRFMTDRLLQVVVTTPADSDGVQIAPAEGAFAAGTCYYNDIYPQGVTLVRHSGVYVTHNESSSRLLMDLSAHLTDNSPVSLIVGVSNTLQSTLSRTPAADTAPLSVAADNTAFVVSTTPLTLTLTEAAGLRDSDWLSVGNASADLTWTVQRRVGDTLVPVTTGETLTITATQTKSGGTLTVSAPDGKQAPGTYLLTVTQTYRGYPVFETPIWFFIDYR